MIVIGAIWEQGWFDSKTELNLWQFPLRDLGADEFAMTPISELNNDKVTEFHSVKDMVQHYGLPVIIVTEHGKEVSRNFKHPESALYLFNRTSGGELPVKPLHTLRIETKINKGMLWGHQAASIILYDRLHN